MSLFKANNQIQGVIRGKSGWPFRVQGLKGKRARERGRRWARLERKDWGEKPVERSREEEDGEGGGGKGGRKREGKGERMKERSGGEGEETNRRRRLKIKSRCEEGPKNALLSRSLFLILAFFSCLAARSSTCMAYIM